MKAFERPSLLPEGLGNRVCFTDDGSARWSPGIPEYMEQNVPLPSRVRAPLTPHCISGHSHSRSSGNLRKKNLGLFKKGKTCRVVAPLGLLRRRLSQTLSGPSFFRMLPKQRGFLPQPLPSWPSSLLAPFKGTLSLPSCSHQTL